MPESEFNRRAFLRASAMAAAASAAPGLSAAGEGGRKPNVILIMTDDQGWGDIHSHGNEAIDTPVLDRLAAGGARFDRFYVSPVCAPTRASLLTGRYSMRTGVHGVTRGYETMRADEVTIAECFRRDGYRTGCFGKWHNGAHYPHHPNGKGFEEFLGFCAGHWNNYFDTQLDRNGTMVHTEGYITDVLTDAALAFIESNRERPFFCYIPYNAPHSPWQVPQRYFDKYKERGLDDVTACAYGMCENIDDNIGRILDQLDDLGLAEDTIVLFLTDNGPNGDRMNGGMRGRKGSAHEGGVRVPLFIRWPGWIAPGTVIEPIAAHIDLLPTLAGLCGVSTEGTLPLDGVSLAPLLLGDDVHWPDRLLFTHWGGRGAVRSQRWRAVTQGGEWTLFDMKADPGQERDVSEKHPNTLGHMQEAYTRWLDDVSRKSFDPIPIPIGYAESPEVTCPGHEAFLYPARGEGIGYVGSSGWANDWVTGWTDAEAFPYWEAEVVSPGEYDFSLLYCCPEECVGTRLALDICGKRLEGEITRAHDPEPIPSPDLIPRKEVYEKEWAELPMGSLTLGECRTRIAVKALTKPGGTVMELKAVRVRKRS